MLVVAGASGAGKSTVCSALAPTETGAIALDADILWRAEFDKPDDGYREFFETWLRVCKNINQAGRSVVLFGAGFGVPSNLEPCIERRYFAAIHYLALVCDERVLRQRLQRRPAWRKSGTPAVLDEQLRFNQWFKDYSGQPPVALMDTTDTTADETAVQVATWIRNRHLPRKMK